MCLMRKRPSLSAQENTANTAQLHRRSFINLSTCFVLSAVNGALGTGAYLLTPSSKSEVNIDGHRLFERTVMIDGKPAHVEAVINKNTLIIIIEHKGEHHYFKSTTIGANAHTAGIPCSHNLDITRAPDEMCISGNVNNRLDIRYESGDVLITASVSDETLTTVVEGMLKSTDQNNIPMHLALEKLTVVEAKSILAKITLVGGLSSEGSLNANTCRLCNEDLIAYSIQPIDAAKPDPEEIKRRREELERIKQWFREAIVSK